LISEDGKVNTEWRKISEEAYLVYLKMYPRTLPMYMRKVIII
jgi:hypothetical protein